MNMVKKLFLLFWLICGTVTANAQSNDTVFNPAQVRRIAFTIDSLTKANAKLIALDSINTQLLKEKDETIDIVSAIGIQYEVIIGKQQEQIALLEADLSDCTVKRNRLQLKRGFKTWFLSGLATGVAAVLLIK